MTKIPEVLKSGSGKRWVWITGVVAIFALLFAIAWNIECERAVAPQELPGEARSFIAQHYPEENPVLVIKTLDELAVTYKVVFADGTQVKFRRNGMWREIKSRSRAVPSAVVPAQIADYVARNFPGTFLVGIEHTCREWEVKLNNTIELTFDDKRFALKEYGYIVPLSRKWGVILFGGKNQLPDRRLVLLCGCYFRLLKSVGYFAFRKAVAECVSFTIAVASCYAVWFRRIFVSRSEESKGATVYRCKWS